MLFAGEASEVIGLLSNAWDWLQERRDPVYLSAKRLIRALRRMAWRASKSFGCCLPRYCMPSPNSPWRISLYPRSSNSS